MKEKQTDLDISDLLIEKRAYVDRNRLAHIDEPQHRITEKLLANDSDRSTSAVGTLLRGGLE
jgi:hypothetical protein